jgi:hypothetical protein
VRFDRRAPAASERHHAAHESQPVRELKPGRRKNHVVVRFEQPVGGQPGPDTAWHVFDQAEA